MPNQYPFYTEGAHDQGVVTQASSNAARTTDVSVAEGRMIVDVQDKIFLLEPKKVCWVV